MPLVMVAGQPSSGKTTIARQLAAMLRERMATAAAEGSPLDVTDVIIVDEPSLHLNRNECYVDMVQEKMARGAIRAATDRSLTKRTIVIVDSLNNIKGYRYELWCISRAMGTRHCCLFVDTPLETCRAWNAARAHRDGDGDGDGEPWVPEVMEDLAGRFETPTGWNRWDAPLFTIKPSCTDEEGVREVLTDVVSALTDKTTTSTTSRVVSKELVPTAATALTETSATNLLHELERAMQYVVDTIMEAQNASGVGQKIIPFLDVAKTEQQPQPQPQPQPQHPDRQRKNNSNHQSNGLKLFLDAPVSLAELRRHKRAFLRASTQNTFGRLKSGGDAAKRCFVEYLQQVLSQR